MFYIAISNRIPSVLVLDTTRKQANARAGWNARRYGVTVSFATDDDRQLLYGIEQDRILAVANENARWGFDADECGVQAAEANAEGLHGM